MRDLFGEAPKQFKPSIGYAGMPGAGPAGEACKSCKWRKRVQHGVRCFNKCGHARGYDSRSEASDIRVSMPACEYWEALEDDGA